VAEVGAEVGRDIEKFIEDGLVASGIPKEEVGAGRHVMNSGRLAERTTMTRTNVEVVTDVIIVQFQGLADARGLGAPNFRRRLNREDGDASWFSKRVSELLHAEKEVSFL